jgi:hypothetical protein
MNKAWSTGQINAGLDQIQKSIGVERKVIQKRRGEIRGEGAKPGAEGQGAPAAEGGISTMSLDQLHDLTSGDLNKLTPEQVQQIQARLKQLQGGQ